MIAIAVVRQAAENRVCKATEVIRVVMTATTLFAA